jgi:hypothetical protein
LHVKIKQMKYILPRIQDIFFLAVFCGAILLGPKMLSIDSDLGRHLAFGQYVLQEHKIPSTDLFSNSKSNMPRPPYEWLAQSIFAIAYLSLGLDGVILLTALVIAIAFTLTYNEAKRRSRLPVTSLLLTTLAAAAASIHWLPRPHIFTFLLLAIWIERLENLRTTNNLSIWQFPLIMFFWANLHGGFVFGLLAWTAYFFGWILDKWRKKDLINILAGRNLLIIGALSFTASCITPDGWGNWQALLGNSSPYILSRTIETMAPNFHQPGIIPYLVLLLLSIILAVIYAAKLPSSHMLLMAGFGILSLLMARNIPLFAISTIPILAESCKDFFGRIRKWMKFESKLGKIDQSLGGFVWPAACIVAVILLFSHHFAQTQTSVNKFDEGIFPVAAVNWLVSHPQDGNMFNEFNWGGYLLYRLWPGQRVFIDSQTDFYGETFVREYSQIINAQNDWELKLNKYDIKWIIVSSGAPLAKALGIDHPWHILFTDSTAIIARK